MNTKPVVIVISFLSAFIISVVGHTREQLGPDIENSKIFFKNNGSREIRIAINGDLTDFYIIKPGEMVQVKKYVKKTIENPEWKDIIVEVPVWREIKKLDIRDPKAILGTITGSATIDMNVTKDLLNKNSREELEKYQGNIIYVITPGTIKGYSVELVTPKGV